MEIYEKKNQPSFISTEEFLSANTNRLVRYSPKSTDLIELIKLIPPRWKKKIENSWAAIEPSIVKVKHRSLKGKWVTVEVNTLKCKDFYNTIHFRKIAPRYQNKKYRKWQEGSPIPLTQKQWNQLFTNLYKKVNQKDSFDIRYRFLHFAHPTTIKLKEIRQGNTDTICRDVVNRRRRTLTLLLPILAKYYRISPINFNKSL